MKKKQSFLRLNTYTIEEVLPYIIDSEGIFKQYGEFLMRMDSVRLYAFKMQGVMCVQCGIEGKFLAQERSHGSKILTPHFNLYAIDDLGDEVLMTVDHIVPKALGGPRTLNNLQVMCMPCNTQKGVGEPAPYFRVLSRLKGHKGECTFCQQKLACDTADRYYQAVDMMYEKFKEHGVPKPPER